MSISEDYRAIREGTAIGSVAPRRLVAVRGSERASYLHGLLTNDIQALAPGSGCYAAWLTPQGRMLTDMHVLAVDDTFLLDLPAEQADAIRERLDQCIFAEDVQLEALDGQLQQVWIHGPSAAEVVSAAVSNLDDPGGWPVYRVSRGRFGNVPAIVVRIDQLAVPGYGIFIAPAEEAALNTALLAAGAVEAAPEAVELARIDARYPLFGIDMTSDTIPLEAGIEDRAISFTKGCYVGQEVIIRVLHRGRGRVARRLVGLRFEEGPPAVGAPLFAGDREVGFVTSAAALTDAGAIGLGYVHRDFVEAGVTVQVRDGEALMPAAVTGAV